MVFCFVVCLFVVCQGCVRFRSFLLFYAMLGYSSLFDSILSCSDVCVGCDVWCGCALSCVVQVGVVFVFVAVCFIICRVIRLHGMASHDMLWHGMSCYDMVWHDSI